MFSITQSICTRGEKPPCTTPFDLVLGVGFQMIFFLPSSLDASAVLAPLSLPKRRNRKGANTLLLHKNIQTKSKPLHSLGSSIKIRIAASYRSYRHLHHESHSLNAMDERSPALLSNRYRRVHYFLRRHCTHPFIVAAGLRSDDLVLELCDANALVPEVCDAATAP